MSTAGIVVLAALILFYVGGLALIVWYLFNRNKIDSRKLKVLNIVIIVITVLMIVVAFLMLNGTIVNWVKAM